MSAEEEIEQLVVAAVARDEDAWRALWITIEAPLRAIVARPGFLGPMSRREDDHRDIAVGVMARLRADSFRRLHAYIAAKRDNPQLRFASWLRVIAKRVAIDHLRGHPDYIRGDRRWIEPTTLPPASELVGERPPVTDRGTARDLLAYAAGEIPDEQRRALELWAHGESFADIARHLGLPNAEKTVRAAIERLRRKFREESSS